MRGDVRERRHRGGAEGRGRQDPLLRYKWVITSVIVAMVSIWIWSLLWRYEWVNASIVVIFVSSMIGSTIGSIIREYYQY